MREDLGTILSAALSAVNASRLVTAALRGDPIVSPASRVRLIAAGKAAVPMTSAFQRAMAGHILSTLTVGRHAPPRAAGPAFVPGGHPLPDERSVLAGRRALQIAADPSGDCLVVLLSGGASAMLAAPVEGVTLDDKQQTTRALLRHGAAIEETNCIRKHLSAVKGGRLAAESPTRVVTLAISDVVGNDLSVIASGPTVPDPTTYEDALRVVERVGVHQFPARAVTHLQSGARGRCPETIKPADERTRRWQARVIGSSADAIAGAREAAARLGYHVVLRDGAVTGEARRSSAAHVSELGRIAGRHSGPVCVLSAGETTVHVRGHGRGGRNQEFALAAVPGLRALGRACALASVGTDGIDGPTDAAGAIADSATMVRASQRDLDPMKYLENNDAWHFFDALGDLIRTGETGTNVGDLQVAVLAPAPRGATAEVQ